MPILEIKGNKYEVDEYHHLEDSKKWTQDFLDHMAKERRITLTRDHNKYIKAARSYYKEYGIVPSARQLKRVLGVGELQLWELFDTTSINPVMKLAGLPRPTGCV